VPRGPGEHLGDVVEQLVRHTRRRHDVRLLAQVLGDEQARCVERGVAVGIERADHQLGAVDVGQRPSAPIRTRGQRLEGPPVVPR
jgi:hypothetical protein